MSVIYNRFAGQSVERLAALSDGIFGVAMTLLLLDLRAPAKELIHSILAFYSRSRYCRFLQDYSLNSSPIGQLFLFIGLIFSSWEF